MTPEQRKDYIAQIEQPEMLDYGVYLNCDKLLTCQKSIDDLCNADELQFQIVHQVEELWMKLINHSLVEIMSDMDDGKTYRALTYFRRVHRLLRLMIAQLDVLETMSPKDYQEIRLQLGNGSGQESPGFRMMLKLAPDLWSSFEKTYLSGKGVSISDIYDEKFDYGEAYAVAEALAELDELLQKFRTMHIFLINRSIGVSAKSLKGRPVEMLQSGAKHQFYPQLWEIRGEMTDQWGASYGVKRASISGEPS